MEQSIWNESAGTDRWSGREHLRGKHPREVWVRCLHRVPSTTDSPPPLAHSDLREAPRSYAVALRAATTRARLPYRKNLSTGKPSLPCRRVSGPRSKRCAVMFSDVIESFIFPRCHCPVSATISDYGGRRSLFNPRRENELREIRILLLRGRARAVQRGIRNL